MKLRILLLSCAICAVTIALWILRPSRPTEHTPSSGTLAETVAEPITTNSLVSSGVGDGGTPMPSQEITADYEQEVQATRRMYMAHASLRTPEVADPDSKANREILEAMVKKALGPSVTQPTPGTPPAN